MTALSLLVITLLCQSYGGNQGACRKSLIECVEKKGATEWALSQCVKEKP